MTIRQSGSNPPPERPPSDAPELARWLTRDLRPKGTPSRPPTQPPPGAGAEPEQAALTDWLVRDLKPKQSLAPRASDAPPASSQAPAAVPSQAPSLAPGAEPSHALSPFALVPADAEPPPSPFALVQPSEEPAVPPSVPQSVAAESPSADIPEPPAALPSHPPSSAIVPARELEDEDLAVLPGRRKTRAPAARRSSWALWVLLLGGVLLGAALLSWRSTQPVAEASAEAGPAAVDLNGALLPPPPASVAEVAEPVLREPSGRARAADEGPEEDPGLADPRSFLGGPSVRRYADVSSRTLSRLATEQRKRARQRDEAARRQRAAREQTSQSASTPPKPTP